VVTALCFKSRVVTVYFVPSCVMSRIGSDSESTRFLKSKATSVQEGEAQHICCHIRNVNARFGNLWAYPQST
jgi:hypothetical protein